PSGCGPVWEEPGRCDGFDLPRGCGNGLSFVRKRVSVLAGRTQLGPHSFAVLSPAVHSVVRRGRARIYVSSRGFERSPTGNFSTPGSPRPRTSPDQAEVTTTACSGPPRQQRFYPGSPGRQ